MATIKSYTDLEQSKKLAEILPHESADMIYIMYNNGEKPQNGDANLSTVYESNEHKWYWVDIIDESWDMRIGEDIPCWSLAALVNIIPFVTLMKDEEGWYGECKSGKIVAWKTELVDVCVVMIEKLHELNLL